MGFCECSFRSFLVADRHVEQHIAWMIWPDLRRGLPYRLRNTDGGRQRRPVDLDRLERIARLVEGLCDHERDRIADMPHLAIGENGIWRAGERIDFEVEQAWKGGEILDVLAGKDHADARESPGYTSIDCEFRMRMGRSKHQRVHRRLRCVVIGVAALAANERIVFLAKDALTHAEFDGSHHISNLPMLISDILQRIAIQRNFSCEAAISASRGRTAAGSIRHRRWLLRASAAQA